MTTLVLIGAALLLLLVLSWVVLRPWRRVPAAQTALQTLNVAVFEQRMQELRQDRERMSAADFAGQERLLQRQLLAATETAPDCAAGVATASGAMPVQVGRGMRWLLGLWVPLLVLLAYVLVNNRGPTFAYLQAQERHRLAAAQVLQGQSPTQSSPIEDGIGLLQAIQTQVYAQPADAQRWLHLSQAYTAVEAPEPAMQALARAHRLAPDDERITMTYAQLRFFTQQGQLDDDTRRMVERLLERQPDHEGAMMLLAMGSFRGGDYAQATDWLERLKALRMQHEAANAPSVLALDKALAEARSAAQNNLRLNVSVQLAPALRAQVQPNDTLFVYVRALTGPPMPYAAHKTSAAALLGAAPLRITLSDQDAMIPGRTLSTGRASGETLVVGARISKTGNPLPQAGDFEAVPVPVGTGQDFALTIAQVR